MESPAITRPLKRQMKRQMKQQMGRLLAFIGYIALSFVVAGIVQAARSDNDLPPSSNNLMTLSQAEIIALKNDNRRNKAKAQQESLKEKSIAANTWPDPKLNLGMLNLPANTFDIQQQNMTQAVVGFTQRIPPWGAVGAKSDQLLSMSEAMGYMVKNQRLLTIVGVRKSWLDVYFHFHSRRLVQESLDVFGQFISVAKFQYRQGRGNQQDVIRAQLEQNLLEDKLIGASTKYEVSVAKLTKWLGRSAAPDSLDTQFPSLPDLPPQGRIEAKLDNHPTVMHRKMRINSAENGVIFADSQLHPGWAFKVQYGFRDETLAGVARDDLFSAMLTFDLPLFTGKRQDHMVAAMKSEVISTLQELDDWRREIKMRFETSAAKHARADERVQLYQGSVLPHSAQNTEATLKAYQSGVTDFNVLVRARLTELKSQLQFFKVKVERAKAHIDLLYYAGAD